MSSRGGGGTQFNHDGHFVSKGPVPLMPCVTTYPDPLFLWGSGEAGAPPSPLGTHSEVEIFSPASQSCRK